MLYKFISNIKYVLSRQEYNDKLDILIEEMRVIKKEIIIVRKLICCPEKK